MNKKFKNDLILVAALLVIAAAGFLAFSLLKTEGDTAVVSIDGEVTARYPLNEEIIKDIITDGGVNTLNIHGGKAFISSASCPDLICCEHTPISNVGETIVCLPNKVVISIESGNTDTELDIVS